jgi:hypothetical protein
VAPPLSVAPARRRQTAEHLPPGQVAVIATNRNVPEPNRVVAFDMHRRAGGAPTPSTVGLVPAGRPWPGLSRPGTWSGPAGDDDPVGAEDHVDGPDRRR